MILEVFGCSKAVFNIVGRGLIWGYFVVRGLFSTVFVRLHVCELIKVAYSWLDFACFDVDGFMGLWVLLW